MCSCNGEVIKILIVTSILLSVLRSAVNYDGYYVPGTRAGSWSLLELGGEMVGWTPCLDLQDLGQCQVTLGGTCNLGSSGRHDGAAQGWLRQPLTQAYNVRRG